MCEILLLEAPGESRQSGRRRAGKYSQVKLEFASSPAATCCGQATDVNVNVAWLAWPLKR